jgi:hypothetical protein
VGKLFQYMFGEHVAATKLRTLFNQIEDSCLPFGVNHRRIAQVNDQLAAVK